MGSMAALKQSTGSLGRKCRASTSRCLDIRPLHKAGAPSCRVGKAMDHISRISAFKFRAMVAIGSPAGIRQKQQTYEHRRGGAWDPWGRLLKKVSSYDD